MTLGQYTRCEISLVLTLVTHSVCFGTSKMRPREIAKVHGWSSNSVFRTLRMAERSRLIIRNHVTGEVILTIHAVDAIKEAFNGPDAIRRKVGSARRRTGHSQRGTERRVSPTED